MPTLREDVLPILDETRALVDELGLRRHVVKIQVITYSGGQVGEGTPVPAEITLDPPPKVKDLSLSLIASSAGLYQAGDISINKISALAYTFSDLWPTLAANQELRWLIDGEPYRLVQRPEERNWDWRVVARKMSQKRL